MLRSVRGQVLLQAAQQRPSGITGNPVSFLPTLKVCLACRQQVLAGAQALVRRSGVPGDFAGRWSECRKWARASATGARDPGDLVI